VKHLQEPRNRRRGSRFSKKDQEDEESDDDSELGGELMLRNAPLDSIQCEGL